MARIALKVDVDTLRGTLEGVPRLVRMLDRLGITATFLFSLGPDHTGWALRRVFRPGFLSKVSRTSVLQHYGLRTLMYGVLLPAPDIGQKAAEPMRDCQRAGHECGLHTWDHVLWQDNVRQRDRAWTRRQMQLAYDRFSEIFSAAPATHGAAGWQMNEHALQQIDDWGLPYASDGRGPHLFRPAVNGQALRHVQLPTTLPTFDELIGVDGIDEGNVHEAILRLTEGTDDQVTDQVFTLHAELEGGLFAPAFEALLKGWQTQGHQLGTVAANYQAIADKSVLPAQPLVWGQISGRSGELMLSN